jgi:DNA topoisomerase IB
VSDQCRRDPHAGSSTAHNHPHLTCCASLLLLLQAAEVHKTAALLGLQSCRSHPSTTMRGQRVVVQNPDVPVADNGKGGAGTLKQTTASVVQRLLPPAAAMKLVEVNGERYAGGGTDQY